MKVKEITVRSLDELLRASRAAAPFKEAVQDLAAGKGNPLVQFNPQSPPVKALRLVMKLLHDYPEFEFERLEIEGQSGCSDFMGEAVAQPGDVKFIFDWNCQWRAIERGWTDHYGDPDQIRAARTYGYQCFRRLEKI